MAQNKSLNNKQGLAMILTALCCLPIRVKIVTGHPICGRARAQLHNCALFKFRRLVFNSFRG